MKIYRAIFDDESSVELEDGEHKIKKFSSGIRYVDIGDLRFIEQNVRKNSQWGKKAREGHKIMWIIKGRTYLVRIFDGEYIELRKKTS